MKKLRVKDIFASTPYLDDLRTSILAGLCTNVFNFYDRGYPLTRVMTPAACEILAENKPVIFAIYHGRIIGMLHIVDDRSKITILISRSRDGEMIARIAENIGFSVARGSPAFKAVEGALQMVAAAQAGQSLMLTVDGPRGPVYKVKTGVIRIAEITGLPLLPFFCNFRSEHVIRKSWDLIAGGLYGSPGLYMIGDPIYVPPERSDEQIEELREKLEVEMDLLRARAEEYWHVYRN
jgi:lysophospholipid acyltransferase (LPLAT)-like uncharacterized protein